MRPIHPCVTKNGLQQDASSLACQHKADLLDACVMVDYEELWTAEYGDFFSIPPQSCPRITTLRYDDCLSNELT
jgi:hypothetical protein